MRSFLKTIGYIVGFFILYVLICMLWGTLYRFYQAKVNGRRSTYEEEMEFGMSCFNILIIVFFIDFGIGYFTGVLTDGSSLLGGNDWYVHLLDYTVTIPFGALTILSILIAGVLNYE